MVCEGYNPLRILRVFLPPPPPPRGELNLWRVRQEQVCRRPSPPASPRAAPRSLTPPSPRVGTSTMPNAKLELDEAAITPVIAELRDDTNPTDYLVLGE